MDRRWFLSKTAGRPKRTAAEGVSSFQVDAMVRQVSQDSDVKVGRLKGMMGHEASRTAPDLEFLKGHPRLTVLVVFHEEGQPIWEQVVCFLHYFHQQSKILDKAIIVLSGVHPPSSILEEWEDQSCCFLVGKLTNTKNLMHAGVEAAKNVIIMGRKRPEESVKLRTTALADAECVTLAGYIEQALADRNAMTGWRASQSVLYEFGYTDSVFLTGHLFEVAQRPAAGREAGQETREKRSCGEQRGTDCGFLAAIGPWIEQAGHTNGSPEPRLGQGIRCFERELCRWAGVHA